MSSGLFGTFIFFDTETNGLPKNCFNPRITELSFLAVGRSDLLVNFSHCPIINKLSLCFNPLMPMQSQAADITGLNVSNLCLQKDFDDNASQLINCFLRSLTTPICIVAHNGYNFDFPLLKSELRRINSHSSELSDKNGNPIYCSDSLHLFRDFDHFLVSSDDKGLAILTSQVIKSQNRFSLSKIYERVFCKSLDLAHTAEGDCMAMIKLVRFLGEPALSWFDVNHKSLVDIPPMYKINNNDPRPLPVDRFPYELD